MRVAVSLLGVLLAAAPATGQAPIAEPQPMISQMGLAELQACGALAIAVDADRENARRRSAQLAARGKAIGAEDKAINAARPTIDVRNPTAVAAFNKRLIAQRAAIDAYNREVDAQRGARQTGNIRIGQYNVQCMQRAYDRAMLSQLPPASAKAISAISSTILVPTLSAEDASGGGPAAGMGGTVNLAGTTIVAPPKTLAMRVADLQVAAAAGDTEAQFMVGLAYLDGQTVARNPEQGIGWLEKAAAKNHPKALYSLSIAYTDGSVPEDDKRAFAYLKRSAEAGLPDAQHNLGIRYASDRYGRPDLPLAIEWMTRAATAGDPESQFVLARFLRRSPGGRKEAAEAWAWMQRSADQGFRQAQQAIGERYQRGKDVPEDNVEALKWYLLASGQTKVDAARDCVRLIGRGSEVRVESLAAIEVLEKAMSPDAVAAATRRADEWVVSFKATKVGGC